MTRETTQSHKVEAAIVETEKRTSPPEAALAERPRRSVADRIGLGRFGAVYIWVILIGVFAVWVPDTFLTSTTLRSVLTEQAVTAIVAIAVVIPLAAGHFDLSVGYTLGASSIAATWLMGPQGQPVWLAVLFALGVVLVVGLINGFLVAGLGIGSFIATLGVGSCLQAFISWLSDGQQIVELPPGFQDLALTEVLGIALPVFYLLVLAVLAWYVLEYTPLGRRLYATGAGEDAARLAGVPTRRLVFFSLVVSALLAGIAGIVAASRVGAGSPEVGPAYLLPAFAAAYLGATQLRPGRPNIWGALLAVYVLATGVKGLQLAGAPFWIPDLFNGVALLLAVGLSTAQRRRAGNPWRVRRGGRSAGPTGRRDVPAPSSDRAQRLGAS